MHCLPIIVRELQVAARRISTYKQRLFAAGFASAVVVVFAMFTPILRAGAGHYLFTLISWVGFIICILEGLRETTDSVAAERRDGTLGLLFLTDLRGQDVIIGKLCAASIKSFTIVLAMMPAFGLPIMMGGVTAGEFWRVCFSFAAAVLLSMTCGTFVSTVSRTPFGAIIGSYLLLCFTMLLPAASILSHGPLPGWAAGPFGMFYFSSDSDFRANPFVFWQAYSYSIILCCVMFGLAARLIGKLSDEQNLNRKTWYSKLLQPRLGYTDTWTRSSIHEDPAIWLAERTLPGRSVLWGMIGLAALICFLVGCLAGSNATILLIVIQLFFVLLLKFWVTVLAVQPLNLAKRSGALELVLCTPVRPPQMVRAHVEVLRAYFLAPGFVASFGLITAGAVGNNIFTSHEHTWFLGLAVVSGLICFISFIIDLYALAYTGLWHGLTEAQIPRAVVKSIFQVLLLPWLCMIVPCVGFLGIILVPWIFMARSNSKLKERFAKEAANQFSNESLNAGWFGRTSSSGDAQP